MIWSFLRGFIQIVFIGFILLVLFELDNVLILYLYVLGMCAIAAQTAKNRFKFFDIFWMEMISITIGGLGIMILVSSIGIIDPIGEYIVPMSGMVIANAMVMTTIVIERLTSDITKSKGRIEAALSLGDSPKNAVRPVIQDSLKAALMPSINRVAVLGIVSIPGLMSGMVIGGTNPIVAAVYQIIIFLMILSAGATAIIIVSILFVRHIFTKDDQFKPGILTNNTR
jgi:putative ABC transport system permease protein